MVAGTAVAAPLAATTVVEAKKGEERMVVR